MTLLANMKKFFDDCFKDWNNMASKYVLYLADVKTNLDSSNVRLRAAKGDLEQLKKIHEFQIKEIEKRIAEFQKDHDDLKETYEYGMQTEAKKMADNKIKSLKNQVDEAIKTMNIPVLQNIDAIFTRIKTLDPQSHDWCSEMKTMIVGLLPKPEVKKDEKKSVDTKVIDPKTITPSAPVSSKPKAPAPPPRKATAPK